MRSFGTEEKPLVVYERPASGIALADERELVEQAKKDKLENYITVKENLDELIEQTRSVVLDAVTEARQNGSPRMYETFAALIRTYSDLNMQLLDLPSKVIIERTQDGGGGNYHEQQSPAVNQAVFIGTNENIVELIKKQYKSTEVSVVECP